jgi:bifunctional pyridoxal-dependent enzyme with beta-cystathionase and maltose regulon repressor activities
LAFVNIQGTGLTSNQMHELLFQKAKVAVVPGLPQWFGTNADGFIRLSFATSEFVLQDALYRMQKTITNL